MPFKMNQVKHAKKFKCPCCQEDFIRRGKKLTGIKMRMKRPNYSGPFCSTTCSASYNYSNLKQFATYQHRLPF